MAKTKGAFNPDDYAIQKSNPIFRTISYILVVLWSVINLYPLFWMVTFSLKDNQQIQKTHKFWLPKGAPKDWIWENYKKLNYNMILTYFKNSIIVTFFAILISLIAAMMASYAITRIKWKLSGLVNAIFMLGITIPVQASLVPIFQVARKMGWLDTRPALIIPYAAFALAMSMLICNGFMTNIPKDLDEAAYIDGCSRFGVFFRIIMPLMLPAVSTIAIYSFLQCWNELMFATVFVNKSELHTVPVGIKQMSGTVRTEYGPVGAIITVATIPMVIIYIILSRKIQDSFIVGAVKG